jgi:hypothetical protein
MLPARTTCLWKGFPVSGNNMPEVRRPRLCRSSEDTTAIAKALGHIWATTTQRENGVK